MRRSPVKLLFGDFAKGRAIELDAIRGVAIFLAMGWHLNTDTGVAAADFLLTPVERFGWVGVDIFFVLSGFLIGGLIIRELDETQTFRAGRFLLRRAFRLWPVLYLYLLAQLAFAPRNPMDYFPQVLFHVQNYFHTPLRQLWSLAVEEQFYLIAALALPFVARRNVSTRSLALGLAALALASIALRTAMWFAGEPHLNLQWETQYRADGLLFGILLALVKQRRLDLYDRLQRHRLVFVALALVACIGLGYFPKSLRELIGVALGTVLGVSLILASDRIDAGRIGRALMRPLAFLGLYSYSIYIWHPGIARIVETKVSALSGSVLLGATAAFVVVVTVSVAITRLVERPMIDLRNRLFPSTHPATQSEARQDVDLTAPRASA